MMALWLFRPMGPRHYGTLLNGPKKAKVSDSRYQLLHQVGGSKTPSHYHEEEYPYLCMEEHHLQVWDTKGARLGQWKAIRQ